MLVRMTREYPAPDQPRGEQCADLGAGNDGNSRVILHPRQRFTLSM